MQHEQVSGPTGAGATGTGWRCRAGREGPASVSARVISSFRPAESPGDAPVPSRVLTPEPDARPLSARDTTRRSPVQRVPPVDLANSLPPVDLATFSGTVCVLVMRARRRLAHLGARLA